MTAEIRERSAEALHLLHELLALLEREGETNWRRGICAAVAHLSDDEGAVSSQGFEEARSIYRSMTQGGRGFAEYYIDRASESDRIIENEQLDDLRSRLSSVFD